MKIRPAVVPLASASAVVSIEPVVLVHGSFANTVRADEALKWWQPRSAFCEALDAHMAQLGSAARCWAHVDHAGTTAHSALHGVYAWSGANAESDRLHAAQALLSHLLRLEGDARVSRYHLVAHSHGGNVVSAALAAADAPLRKLAAVVYLGTPVLQFRHLDMTFARWTSSVLACAVLAAGVWAWPLWPEQQMWLVLLMVAAALGLLFDVRRAWQNRQHSRPTLTRAFSARRHAFSFEPDEAYRALETARKIEKQPRVFLWQWLKTGRSKSFVVPVSAQTTSPLGERVAASGLDQAAAALEREAPQGSMPGVASVRAPGALNEVDVVMPVLASVVHTLPLGHLMPVLLRAMAWFAVLCSAAIAMVARSVLAVFAKLAAGVVLLAMFVMLWITLPWLIRRTAFGQDRGLLRSLGRLPPGVAQLEVISHALAQEAQRVCDASALRSGADVWGSVSQCDPMAIRSRVEECLANPAMAHSYYQHAPEVQLAIARLIAGKAATDIP